MSSRAVMDGLRERGLVDADGRFTDAGRETRNATSRAVSDPVNVSGATTTCTADQATRDRL